MNSSHQRLSIYEIEWVFKQSNTFKVSQHFCSSLGNKFSFYFHYIEKYDNKFTTTRIFVFCWIEEIAEQQINKMFFFLKNCTSLIKATKNNILYRLTEYLTCSNYYATTLSLMNTPGTQQYIFPCDMPLWSHTIYHVALIQGNLQISNNILSFIIHVTLII